MKFRGISILKNWLTIFYLKNSTLPCQLAYIPNRLLPNGRNNNPVFYVGERLYRRCALAEIEDPFNKISLVDLSLNRSGENHELCEKEDVLYNTNPDNENAPQKFDLSIATLIIQELTNDNIYFKEFNEVRESTGIQEQLCVQIKLKHKLEPCNYAHSSFEFYYNGQEVTYDNYKNTLGHKNSKIFILRTKCKNEIAKMVVKGLIKIHWDI